MSTHPHPTPGPWLLSDKETKVGLIPGDSNPDFRCREIYVEHKWIALVSHLGSPSKQDEYEANARLIAAAPDLLEALKNAAWVMAPLAPPSLLEAMHAAIAKACEELSKPIARKPPSITVAACEDVGSLVSKEKGDSE